MKFSLNITDMNEEEFARIFHAIHIPTGDNVTADVEEESEIDTPLPNVDKEGLPWDARIHSSNHKLTAKGVWQRRKGITDDEFNAVKNELLGLSPVESFVNASQTDVVVQEVVAPAPIPMTVAPEIPNPFLSHTTPVVQVSAPATPNMQPVQVSAPATPNMQPVQVSAPAPVAPAIDSAVIYQTMIDKIKNGLASQKVKANDVQNLVTAVNTQFGTQYQSLAQVKDNIPAIQYVINDLTVKGL